jgi:hypothetical protein
MQGELLRKPNLSPHDCTRTVDRAAQGTPVPVAGSDGVAALARLRQGPDVRCGRWRWRVAPGEEDAETPRPPPLPATKGS